MNWRKNSKAHYIIGARCIVPLLPDKGDKGKLTMSEGIYSKMHGYVNRPSIRLKDYDYSKAGAYFITICVQNREHLLGAIENNEMKLNEAGRIAYNEWIKTPEMRPTIELDAFVIMPNHIHGILIINDPDTGRGTMHRAPTGNRNNQVEQFGKPTSNTIPTIIRGYKSSVTKQINILCNKPGMPFWQRNYYEHIIRSREELNRINEYIINNPAKWDEDQYN